MTPFDNFLYNKDLQQFYCVTCSQSEYITRSLIDNTETFNCKSCGQEKVNRYWGGQGILQYGQIDEPVSLRLIVPQDLGKFYRALIPKYYPQIAPKYKYHISVIRKTILEPSDLWGKYEGESVQFYYSNNIRRDNWYYWLDAYSQRLEEILAELGLPLRNMYYNPIGNFRRTFHITIGNQK